SLLGKVGTLSFSILRVSLETVSASICFTLPSVTTSLEELPPQAENTTRVQINRPKFFIFGQFNCLFLFLPCKIIFIIFSSKFRYRGYSTPSSAKALYPSLVT